jgi:hypothetical protein
MLITCNTQKMLWPSKVVDSSMISLGMTFGNTNEIWAMPKKSVTK